VSRRLKVTLDPDELTATILAMLLVAAPGAAPTLGQYAGRSELKRWLEVVIGHEALKLERKQARADSLQDALLEAMVSDGLVEWKEMDAATRQSFKQALVRALEGLSARDRSLLHLRLDGWNMADMATLFHVRHTTISRWLARVNVAVDHAVRRELRESLRLDGSDFESLVRSFLSRMDSSIRCQVSRACGGEER
jgi:RNA polymerase sigma-70 factor